MKDYSVEGEKRDVLLMVEMSRTIQRRLRRGFMIMTAGQHGQLHEGTHRPTLSWKGEHQVLSSSVAESDLHTQASCRLASAEIKWISGGCHR